MSVIDPGPGKMSPESGDMLAMSDFVSDFDPGPGEPLLQSGISLDMPNFAGDVAILQVPDADALSVMFDRCARSYSQRHDDSLQLVGDKGGGCT